MLNFSMVRTSVFFTLGLVFLSSCKGHRFYWETKFLVTNQNPSLQENLIRNFSLTDNLSTWHPVFGKYCSAVPSNRGHLFVCWKDKEVRVISSYTGALKGDGPVRTKDATIQKYLVKISSQDGYNDHREIKQYVRKNYRVTGVEERLLTYGRGSIMIKNELGEED